MFFLAYPEIGQMFAFGFNLASASREKRNGKNTSYLYSVYTTHGQSKDTKF